MELINYHFICFFKLFYIYLYYGNITIFYTNAVAVYYIDCIDAS